MVQDMGIAAALRRQTTLDKTAGDLVQMANQNGGRDNIAVLLVRAAEANRQRHFIDKLLGRSQ
jgi:protein phosphatase